MARGGFADPRAGVTVRFDTRTIVAAVDTAMLQAAGRILDEAKAYWHDVEWTEARHPEMTGDERDQGIFEVQVQEGHSVRIIIGSSAKHAIYEEYGTIHRAGHMPIRQTIDAIAYKAAPIVRRAARRALKKAR